MTALGSKIFENYVGEDGGIYIGLAYWLQTREHGVPMIDVQCNSDVEIKYLCSQMRADIDRLERVALRAMRSKNGEGVLER